MQFGINSIGDIQPVSQQFIKRADGRYAMVDLYFPQLNIGIECDEAYHIDNSENDHRRELKMTEMLSAYEETEDFMLSRVKAYQSWESIEKQIDDVVSGIKDRIRKGNYPLWHFNEKPYNVAIANKMIRVVDRLCFNTIVDICRCFGKEYKGMQSAYFHIGNGYQLWCPKLAIYQDGKHRSVSKGWINILSNDWETVTETNDCINKVKIDGTNVHLDRPRILFGKSMDVLGRNAYRFIGVFQISLADSSNTEIIHKRISKYLDLSPWLNKEI